MPSFVAYTDLTRNACTKKTDYFFLIPMIGLFSVIGNEEMQLIKIQLKAKMGINQNPDSSIQMWWENISMLNISVSLTKLRKLNIELIISKPRTAIGSTFAPNVLLLPM